MVRKKAEGDEDQRRAASHHARRAGEAPGARSAAAGASKQRTHLPARDSHSDKLAARRRGRQRERSSDRADVAAREAAAGSPDRIFRARGHPDYTHDHERVFRALVEAERERGGEGVHLDEIAQAAALPREETRRLLHDLVAVHRLVTELRDADTPDLGPRYEIKPRL